VGEDLQALQEEKRRRKTIEGRTKAHIDVPGDLRAKDSCGISRNM